MKPPSPRALRRQRDGVAPGQLALFEDDAGGAAPDAAVPVSDEGSAASPPSTALAHPTRDGPAASGTPGVAPADPWTSGAPMAWRHPRATRELRLGDAHLVGYALRRARRRSIGFVVDADGLTVSAPRWVSAGAIDDALREKAGWVLRKLAEQRERSARLAATRIDWRDGAELRFLGAPLRLRLDPGVSGAVFEPAPAASPPPATSDVPEAPRAHDPLGAALALLRLGLPPQAAPAQIRDAFQGWLQRQARRLFAERCELYAPQLGVRVTRLSLSSAGTRWGSASADGAIRLHWRLMHFSLATIDYVVVHELAHLREMNHGPAFWRLVQSVVPQVEAARAALRDEVLPAFD